MSRKSEIDDGQISRRSRIQNSDPSHPLSQHPCLMDGSDRMIADQTTQAGQLQRVATPRSSGPSIISMGGRRPSQHSHLSQQIVEELQQKFRFQDEQLAELSQHQLIMEETANKLATNLTTALEQLANSQGRSEAITKLHAEAIQSAQHQNTAIKDQNQQVEDVTKAHRTLIEMQLKDREGMIQQIKNLFQEQSVRLGAQESENVIMKERLLLMREENKQRRRLDTETPKIGLAHRSPVKRRRVVNQVPQYLRLGRKNHAIHMLKCFPNHNKIREIRHTKEKDTV